MTKSSRTRVVLLLAAAAAAVAPGVVAAERDPQTGLVVDDGWTWARAHCGGCHSYRLVTNQRGDAAYWRDIIAWMQAKQNLWQIPEPQFNELVSYLARNYDEDDPGRRPPLAPELMPKRP